MSEEENEDRIDIRVEELRDELADLLTSALFYHLTGRKDENLIKNINKKRFEEIFFETFDLGLEIKSEKEVEAIKNEFRDDYGDKVDFLPSKVEFDRIFEAVKEARRLKT